MAESLIDQGIVHAMPKGVLALFSSGEARHNAMIGGALARLVKVETRRDLGDVLCFTICI